MTRPRPPPPPRAFALQELQDYVSCQRQQLGAKLTIFKLCASSGVLCERRRRRRHVDRRVAEPVCGFMPSLLWHRGTQAGAAEYRDASPLFAVLP